MDKPLWGLRVLKFDGAIAPRVLKFDSGSAAEGCGGRLLIDRRRPLIKNLYNRPGGRGRFPPLVAGATTFPPRWEACHWILGRLRLPANPVPLPPQAGALWMLSHGAMSLQESIEIYSAP